LGGGPWRTFEQGPTGQDLGHSSHGRTAGIAFRAWVQPADS
jgi:hypothetical protein